MPKTTNNKQPASRASKECQFCKPRLAPVKDMNGKDTGKKVMEHDVTIPHPTVFGITEANKYFG